MARLRAARLQAACGPLVGSIVLGVLWALWHLPLFWSGVWTPPTVANIVIFIVMITLLTVVMTWVFNNANGSLLITMLMHASFNTFANRVVAPLFPAPLLNDYGVPTRRRVHRSCAAPPMGMTGDDAGRLTPRCCPTARTPTTRSHR